MIASFGDVFVDPLSSGLFPAVFGCVCVHVERDDAHHRVRIIGFDLGQVAGCRDWFAVFEFREYPSAGCVLGHEQRFGQVASFGDAPGKIRNLDSIASTAVSEWDENYRIRKLHLVFLLMRSS